MNKTSVLELIFYAVLQQSEKQQNIFSLQRKLIKIKTGDILGSFYLTSFKKSMNKTSVLELIFYAVLQQSEKQQNIFSLQRKLIKIKTGDILGSFYLTSLKKSIQYVIYALLFLQVYYKSRNLEFLLALQHQGQ